jgi:hypothetical protein
LQYFFPDCLISFILRIIVIHNYLISIFLYLALYRVGKYIYTSKLFFNILKQSAMNTIAKKSVNAGKLATKQEVDTFTSTYKQERWADNSDRMGKADSLSVWFTVEELEGFLENVRSKGGDSVRFHFGVFPEGYENPEFAGRQTLVMVGNRSKDGSYSTSKELFSDNNGQPEIVAYLGGIICPPWCGTGGKGKAALIDRGDKGLSVI